MAALPLQTHLSQATSFNKTFKARAMRLGDGFSNRVKDSLNSTVWKGTCQYENLTSSELNTLSLFFDDIGSWGTFDYQPKGAPASMKFSVDEAGLQITNVSGDLYNVSFSCRAEFDL